MKIGIIVVLVVVYLGVLKLLSSTIQRLGVKKNVNRYRVLYINRTLALCLTFSFVVLFIAILDIKSSQITLFLSSIFAVIGVALFAQWSILSNITASIIIFFSFPYRIGDAIRIIEESKEITGVIEDITLFHVLIRRTDDMVIYPNSVILQKAVIKNQQDLVE